MNKALQEFQRLRDGAEVFSIETDGLRLPLKRHRGKNGGGPPVLLLHGGSTCSDIFLVPNGGLVQFLLNRGWEVWTLDWRGSCRVVDPLLATELTELEHIQHERALFTLDRVAEQDVPLALAEMRKHVSPGEKIGVVAFCAGAGALSMAVARGKLRPFHVDNIVLMTLGLFYETPWDGWVKAEDFLIERVMVQAPRLRGISPHERTWVKDMELAYDRWPKAWFEPGSPTAQEMYRRLTFMFGEPYASSLELEMPLEVLRSMFGHLHLGLYLHLGQQVRRGYAARFDALDVLDRARAASKAVQVANHDLNADPFYDGNVVLLAGARNRLWHRDSIDLMYEWLRSNAPPDARKSSIKKHILPEYAHLDMLWGPRAREDVYELIKDSLDPASASDSLVPC